MTLEELGTSPERALHLGDHIANDIEGGNRAGMWTALLGDADGQEADCVASRARADARGVAIDAGCVAAEGVMGVR